MDESFYFAIVGTRDNPVYELESAWVKEDADPSAPVSKNDQRHLNQFIVHSALDVVDDLVWTTNNAYLKVVDRYNDWLISAYVLPSGVKFMLLHDSKNEDGIKSFFTECHELYVKILMNPFYQTNDQINSNLFDGKLKAIARKHLT